MAPASSLPTACLIKVPAQGSFTQETGVLAGMKPTGRLSQATPLQKLTLEAPLPTAGMPASKLPTCMVTSSTLPLACPPQGV